MVNNNHVVSFSFRQYADQFDRFAAKINFLRQQTEERTSLLAELNTQIDDNVKLLKQIKKQIDGLRDEMCKGCGVGSTLQQMIDSHNRVVINISELVEARNKQDKSIAALDDQVDPIKHEACTLVESQLLVCVLPV